MQLNFSGPYQYPTKHLLRLAGYAEYTNRMGETSYVRQMGGKFPRLHIYIKNPSASGFGLSIHLDQKAACYDQVTLHSGEYDSEVVEKEAIFLQRKFAENLISAATTK